MPYIKEEDRKYIAPALNELLEYLTDNDGMINYVITNIITSVYGSGGYAKYNRAMGVLDCVAREFYRRRIVPYEDKKIQENGDVY